MFSIRNKLIMTPIFNANNKDGGYIASILHLISQKNENLDV